MSIQAIRRAGTATILMFGLFGCSEPEVIETPEIVRPVKLVEVVASDNVREYRLPAIVEALSSKDLVFQVNGQITVLNVRESDQVEAGDIIAELDPRVFQNQLDAAQTQVDTAKIEFERAQRLIAADAIAKSIFDQRETAYNVALTNLDNAKKALEDTKLIAPFAGIIANTYVEELNAVTPNTPIVTIQTNGPAEAKVRLPASLVSRFKQIDALNTYVVLDTEGSQQMPAELVGAITLADERSQTFEVSFSFTPLPNMTVFPGMTGVVISNIAFTDNAKIIGKIFVPMSSVLSDASGQYVWILDSNTSTVKRRDVTVGEIDGERITVDKGLNEGDTIIGAGGSYLQEGTKVRPLES